MKYSILLPSLMLLFPLSSSARTSAAQKQKVAAEQQKIIDKNMVEIHSRLNGLRAEEPGLRDQLGEFIVDGESEAIEEAVNTIITTVLHRKFNGETEGIAKGDHGKAHACLTGKIKFNDQIDPELAKGVVIPGKEYNVLSRLSNGEPPADPDRASTTQGVALKLLNVKGDRLPDFPATGEQDFLMTSSPIFFVSNIVEYNPIFMMRADGKVSIGEQLSYMWAHPSDFGVRLIAKLRAYSRFLPGKPASMMTHPYWGKHPYAWGERGDGEVDAGKAVKYSVIPCASHKVLPADSSAENYQQDFIKGAFEKNGEICFHFRIQKRPQGASERALPIEDANVEWTEDVAPFVNVATVTFKAEDNKGFEAPEKVAACNQTEFSPWNGLKAHQPMSNLARGRRYVYKASALVRELNR